jgi:hypothetical protein
MICFVEFYIHTFKLAYNPLSVAHSAYRKETEEWRHDE